MKDEYKIFRVFCIVAAVILFSLLVTTGIMTAKYQTEQTVFGDSHSVIQIYERDNGFLMNLNGKISETEPQKWLRYADVLSYTLFAPVNNFIQLGKAIIRIGNQ